MDPYSYLPAWRWTSPSIHSNYGIAPGMNELLTGLASIFFSVGSVMWEILLWVIRFATDTNIVQSLAGEVNKVVADTYNAIMGGSGTVAHSALIGSILFLIAGYTIFMTVRAGPGAALRTAIRCLVPLALLVVMCGAAIASQSGTPKPPSPGWVATTVNNDVQGIATILPNTIANITPAGSAKNEKAPSCYNYQQNLETTYQFLVNAQKQYHSLTNGDSQIPIVVNDLWTSSYLSGWEQSQFGDPTLGQRVGCRYLEINRRTPATNQTDSNNNIVQLGQSEIEQVANDTGGVPAAGNPTPATNSSTVYGPYGGDDGRITIAMTAWASCYWDGGQWQFTPDFLRVVSNGDSADPHDGTNNAPQACSDWWAGWKNSSNDAGGPFGTGSPGQTQAEIASATTNANVAQDFFNSWNGNNGGASLLYGFFTMISSAAFLFSIGGLALGTVLAQILLILILCALPILLLVMAMPGNVGKRVGSESLKIGLGAAISKIIFMLLLGILVNVINIMNAILPEVSGSLGVLVSAMTPLIAFFAIHTLLKRMGFGGLMSVKGAVMTTAAITGKAAKDGSLTGPEQALRSRGRAMTQRGRGGNGGRGIGGGSGGRGPRRLPRSRSDPGPSPGADGSGAGRAAAAGAAAGAVLTKVRGRAEAAKERMGQAFTDGVGVISKMGRPGAWTAAKIGAAHGAAARMGMNAQRSITMAKWRASNAFQMKRDRLQNLAGNKWGDFKQWGHSARQSGTDTLYDGFTRSVDAQDARQQKRNRRRVERPDVRRANREASRRVKDFAQKTKRRSRGL